VLLAGLIVTGILVVGALWLYVTGARGEPAASSNDAGEQDPGDAPLDSELERGAVETALVVLVDNRWDACAFDGYEETWRRFTAEDVRGFAGVPGGRHRVVTRCEGGEARLDFVVAPGQVIAARLDASTARWSVLADPPARPPDSALVAHRMVLGVARAMRGDAIVAPEELVTRTVRELRGLVARKDAGADAQALLAQAERLGEALIGVPLSRAQLRTLREALSRRAGVPPDLAVAVLPDTSSSAE
jgi:hypothetical protein